MHLVEYCRRPNGKYLPVRGGAAQRVLPEDVAGMEQGRISVVLGSSGVPVEVTAWVDDGYAVVDIDAAPHG